MGKKYRLRFTKEKGGLEKPPFLLQKNRSPPGYPISRLRVDIPEESIDLYCKI